MMAVFICGVVILLFISIQLCVLIEDGGVWAFMFPIFVGLAMISIAYFTKTDVTVEEQISKNNKKIERLIQENSKLESLKEGK